MNVATFHLPRRLKLFASTVRFCAAIALVLAPGVAGALAAPQDNWEAAAPPCCTGPIGGADYDDQGNIFVATATASPQLQKLDRNGVLVASSAISEYGLVRVAPDNSIYIANSSQIARFSNNLTQLPSIPIANVGVFDVDAAGRIIGSSATNQPSLYGADGTFTTAIGTQGNDPLAGNVGVVRGLSFDRAGAVLIFSDFGNNSCLLLTFSLAGEVLRPPKSESVGTTYHGCSSDLHGVFYAMRVARSGLIFEVVDIIDQIVIEGTSYGGDKFSSGSYPLAGGVGDLTVSPSGDILVFNLGKSTMPSFYKPGFRSQQPLARPRIPQPRVIAVNRRPGSTISDIDFVVSDEDDSTISAYPLAFLSGVSSLSNAVVMQALVEGTSVNVGSNVPVSTTRRISWDAAQDLGTAQPFVSADIVILAKDARGIIDFDFVEIPAGIPNAGDPILKMTRSPLSDTDLLNAWLWLVASRDARITFSGGQVIGASGGPYAGQILASGTSTTDQGRAFLFSALGVREATPAEVTRAREATTPGFVNQFPPRAQMHGLPVAVNQFGIDTGFVGGYWIVLP